MAQKSNRGGTFLSIEHVRKSFGGVQVLDDVHLEVEQGSFFTLLGPSGCGKTTLLRLIAGFDSVDEGSINLEGKPLDSLPAAQRPINTVFQNYALFPHLSVAGNVAFGLERLRLSKADINKRVAEVVRLVKMEEFIDRYPAQLSGGQQQRVALARAMAPAPKILLLDEPLSALDLKLRQAMRLELKRIQREVRISFIFVTHDQEEALSLSDRIAVMNKGRVLQVGTPKEIYEKSNSIFVADFIGEANIMSGAVSPSTAGKFTSVSGHQFSFLPDSKSNGTLPSPPHYLCFRPEHCAVKASKDSNDFRLMDIDYLGSMAKLILHHEKMGRVQALIAPDKAANLKVGGHYALTVEPDRARILFS
ncbi:MAG: ABC transporter ATP-binding protein [Alphaproteobacteria bacterium]|nr:ABC transporter ATP-binding protein [Alphaproteobacteria bacterium]